jgi:hypothetical protein
MIGAAMWKALSCNDDYGGAVVPVTQNALCTSGRGTQDVVVS